MLLYIHTKIFFLFTGTFELLLGLYLLMFDKGCLISSCSSGETTGNTLAKILIFSGVVSFVVHSFEKTPKIAHFFLSLVTSFPLVLLLIPSIFFKDFYQAVPLLIITSGLLIAPFLPKNPLAKFEYHLFPLIISSVLILSSPLFFFTPPGSENLNLIYKCLSLTMALSGILLGVFALSQPFSKHPKAYVLSAISFQAFTLHGLLENLPVLTIMVLSASIFILGLSFFEQIYSLKNFNKELTFYQKISKSLETVFWLSIFVIFLTIIQTPKLLANSHLPLFLVSLVSVFSVIYFHLLPKNIFTQKNLPPSLIVYNIFSLLVIAVTGGFTSPLLFLLVFFFLISACYLKRKYLVLFFTLDLEFFIGFLLLSGLNKENLASMFFDSLLLLLVAFIIFKILELKQNYASS